MDQSIRQTFAEVTGGGSAWLEIENPAEETSGIMLVVQFLTSLDENLRRFLEEKTMAATIFLLALQSLKPSLSISWMKLMLIWMPRILRDY